MGRWVCLDVGETLIDETRVWGTWADVLGIPRLTFMAAVGAAVERGWDYRHVFEIVDAPDWRRNLEVVERRYGGFRSDDLYPDAVTGIDGLRDRGFRVAIVANQPASRTGELRALGIDVEVMAMSEALGAAKPAAAFFERTLSLLGGPDPSDVAYVGDRIDNDVVPAAEAGMRAVWLRRGPWGVIPRESPAQASLVVSSLAELVERIDECWAPASSVTRRGRSPS
ncbi:MAG TPA: HAD family hydrolase, partial [Candidatus Saccharimonadia bacterium]|nr:HAD family hydrolase [Candidatus Saccharimonadia bacterium]